MPLLFALEPATMPAMAAFIAATVVRVWMSAFSAVSWPRISTLEFGELLAGFLGSKGMVGKG